MRQTVCSRSRDFPQIFMKILTEKHSLSRLQADPQSRSGMLTISHNLPENRIRACLRSTQSGRIGASVFNDGLQEVGRQKQTLVGLSVHDHHSSLYLHDRLDLHRHPQRNRHRTYRNPRVCPARFEYFEKQLRPRPRSTSPSSGSPKEEGRAVDIHWRETQFGE